MAAIERNPSAPQADSGVIDALKGIGVALLRAIGSVRETRRRAGLAPCSSAMVRGVLLHGLKFQDTEFK